jgi:hypothetical protein
MRLYLREIGKEGVSKSAHSIHNPLLFSHGAMNSRHYKISRETVLVLSTSFLRASAAAEARLAEGQF